MVSKEADVIRAAEALKAIKALVEANQTVDEDVLTLDAVVWRAPNETVHDDEEATAAPAAASVSALQAAMGQLSEPAPVGITPTNIGTVAPNGSGHTPSPARIVAEPAPLMDEDPYAIFELDNPIVTSRLGTADAVNAELPTERPADLARAALREQREEQLDRKATPALTPSPILQPTTERTMPDVGENTSYADFSMDEHEAMMSTPLPTALSPQQNDTPQLDDDLNADDGRNGQAQLAPDLIAQGERDAKAQNSRLVEENTEIKTNPVVEQMSIAEPVEVESSKPEPTPSTPSTNSTNQIPLHVVADNGVQEGDEINPQEVMRTALRSMIRDQIGNWLEDNINGLIEDALREPSTGRTTAPARKNNKNNNPID